MFLKLQTSKKHSERRTRKHLHWVWRGIAKDRSIKFSEVCPYINGEGPVLMAVILDLR
jgi:hypothetical protein